jgi:hypothetical protein
MTVTVVPKSSWLCPYCHRFIEVTDLFVDGTDHMLDHHADRLIADRPLIKHTPR